MRTQAQSRGVVQAHEDGVGRLVLTYDSSALARFFGVLTLVFVFAAAYRFAQPGRATEQHWGLIGASATCLVITLACFERSRFVIDARARMVEWQRRIAWFSRRGTFMFDQITGITTPQPIGDEGIPSRRIVFITKQGEVPVTVSFNADHDDAMLALAGRLRDMLQLPEDEKMPDNISALIAAGHEMDAIRALRTQRGCSLLAAQAEVRARRTAKR